jgi:hypothetical protein
MVLVPLGRERANQLDKIGKLSETEKMRIIQTTLKIEAAINEKQKTLSKQKTVVRRGKKKRLKGARRRRPMKEKETKKQYSLDPRSIEENDTTIEIMHENDGHRCSDELEFESRIRGDLIQPGVLSTDTPPKKRKLKQEKILQKTETGGKYLGRKD